MSERAPSAPRSSIGLLPVSGGIRFLLAENSGDSIQSLKSAMRACAGERANADERGSASGLRRIYGDVAYALGFRTDRLVNQSQHLPI